MKHAETRGARLIGVVGQVFCLYLLPFVAVAGLGLASLRGYLRACEPRLRHVAAEYASSFLGTRVVVDGLELHADHALVMGVHIRDPMPSRRGNGQWLAEAGVIRVPLDVGMLARFGSRQEPMVPEVTVRQASVRLHRDRHGRWNFSQLLRPAAAPPARRWMGRLTLRDCAIEVRDEALLHHPDRQWAPVAARLDASNGYVYWAAPDAVTWRMNATGVSPSIGALRVTGSYSSSDGRFIADARFGRAIVPLWLNRFLPRGFDVERGTVSGAVLLMRTSRTDSVLRYLARFGVRDATGRIPWLRVPVTVLDGTVEASYHGAAGTLTALVAGKRVPVAGRVAFARKPSYQVDLRLSGMDSLELTDAINADLSALRRRLHDFPSTLWGDVRFYGTAQNMRVSASGTALVRSRLDHLIELRRPARLDLAVEGDLASPVVAVRGQIPHLSVAGVEVAQTRVWAHGGRPGIRVSGSGSIGRGRLAVWGSLIAGGERWSYDGWLQGRGLEVARAWQSYQQVSKHWGLPVSEKPTAVGGVLQMDVAVHGRLDSPPQVHALVQVLAPKMDNVTADRVEVSADFVGSDVTIHRVLVESGSAVAAAHGALDLNDNRGVLDVSVNGWPVTTLAQWVGASTQEPIGGLMAAGRVHLEGDVENPRVSGSAYFTGLRYGKLDSDRAVLSLGGSLNALRVDGLLERVPAVCSLQATVRRLLSGNPWILADAQLDGLDLEDVTTIAELPWDLIGVVGGSAAVSGPIQAPTVDSWHLQSAGIWAGDLAIGPVTATGSARIGAATSAVDVDSLRVEIGGGEVRASGRLWSNGEFSARCRLSNVPLGEFTSYWARYAEVSGTLDADADVTGHYSRDEPVRLTGTVSLTTRGLTINGETLGEAWADVALEDRTVRGNPRAGRPGVAGIANASGGLIVKSLAANWSTGEATANIALDALPLDTVRRAIGRSPVVAANADGGTARGILSALEPIAGRATAEADVRIAPDKWLMNSKWTSRDLWVADMKVAAFDCALQATGEAVVVQDLTAQAGDATLTASGELIFGKQMHGSVVAQGIDVATIAQWLPANHPLESLRGTIDSVSAEVSGVPDAPSLAVVATARGLKYTPSSGKDAPVTMIAVPAARLSGVVHEGEVRCDDLAMVLGNTSSPPTSSGGALELHASGSMPFSWKHPQPAETDRLSVTLRLPDQPLEALQSVLSSAGLDMKGSIGGEVNLAGNVGAWRRLAEGQEVTAGEIAADGELRLRAAHVSSSALHSMLSDVNLAASLRSNILSVGPIDAGKPVARLVTRSTPTDAREAGEGGIYLDGALPLVGSEPTATGLTITAPKLAFDESPLPGFTTGRLVGELATETGEPGLQITIRGSVMDPLIAGTATLRRTVLRLPATEPLGKRQPYAGIIDPRFDIAIRVADRVSVTNSLMLASLYTNTGQPVRVTGTLSAPKVQGSLAISGGRISFPTARFTIARGGRVDIRYPGLAEPAAEEAGLTVSVDLRASAFVTARSVTGMRRRYRITVDAKGPLTGFGGDTGFAGEPQLRLAYRSEPPDLALSQGGVAQKITALLGGQEAIQAVFSRGGAASGILMGQAAEYLGGTLLSDIVAGTGLQEALGLQELSVDYSATGAFTLRLSRVLYGPLEASYWRRIAGGTETVGDAGAWELRLGLRLQNAFRLSYSLDSQRTNAFLLEGVYSF